ncbi:MAG: ABC transporter substrate-binding protein, partial [Oscillospiraceae bacterium]|nr:ABC transporter substrate-binding protein [Oscillospiraceae bacterium]
APAAAPAADAAPAAGAFKLGSQGPLTGGAAIYGIAVMNGIQIAVDEINAMDDGFKFEFQSQDDEADAGDKAINAYNALMDWGMQVMAGTVTSGSGITVSAQAYQDRLFMLTPSGSSTDLTADKDNAYQVCFTDPNQGVASADYMASNFAGAKVAVIYRNDDAYSQGIHDTFVAEAAAKGVEVVYEGGFVDGTADFNVYLTAAKDADADMLFLPIYYQPASVIITQASQMGYAPTFFGVDGMDGILGQEGFDTALAEGVFLLTPFAADADDAQTQAFVAEYQKRFGEVPNQFAADGYDAAYILKAALQAAGCTPDMSAADICDAVIGVMTSISYDGVTGKGMTWQSNGEVSKAPMAVVIKDGAYVTPEF